MRTPEVDWSARCTHGKSCLDPGSSASRATAHDVARVGGVVSTNDQSLDDVVQLAVAPEPSEVKVLIGNRSTEYPCALRKLTVPVTVIGVEPIPTTPRAEAVVGGTPDARQCVEETAKYGLGCTDTGRSPGRRVVVVVAPVPNSPFTALCLAFPTAIPRGIATMSANVLRSMFRRLDRIQSHCRLHLPCGGSDLPGWLEEWTGSMPGRYPAARVAGTASSRNSGPRQPANRSFRHHWLVDALDHLATCFSAPDGATPSPPLFLRQPSGQWSMRSCPPGGRDFRWKDLASPSASSNPQRQWPQRTADPPTWNAGVRQDIDRNRSTSATPAESI